MSLMLPTLCSELSAITRARAPRHMRHLAKGIERRPISSTSGLFRPDREESSSESSARAESSRSAKSSKRLRVDIPSTSTLPQGVAHGIEGFLSMSSLETVDLVQGDLWKKLQAEIRNQPLLQQWWIEHGSRFDIASLITKTAQEPTLSLAYNYACMILNNSYFLECLSAQPSDTTPLEHKLLEQHAVARANGMSGSGWLWIVAQASSTKPSSSSTLKILPTYGSGTLLVRHGVQVGRASGTSLYRPQPQDESDEAGQDGPFQETSAAKSGGPSSSSPTIKPLACLSLFEHAYMHTYGVLGRERYVRDWFRSLDWTAIQKKGGLGG